MIEIPTDLKGQKAVPFMEQFGLTERLGTELSLKEITSIRWTYYVFYSQPFEAGMFAELFKEVQIEKRFYGSDCFRHYVEDELISFIKDTNIMKICQDFDNWYDNRIPKTLNDFIVICNNSRIKLKWKEKQNENEI